VRSVREYGVIISARGAEVRSEGVLLGRGKGEVLAYNLYVPDSLEVSFSLSNIRNS
jgi:hypothetical protein